MSQSPIQIVDAHLHLFNLKDGDYHWLKRGNPPFWADKAVICRDFTENDLQLAGNVQLAGFIHIEAGFDNIKPWREIAWLESHCSVPFRSVAFADLLAVNFAGQLEKLSHYSSVAGIRHILDGQAAEILSSPIAQRHLALLADKGFSFDAQLNIADKASLHALLNTLQAHPNLRVIINHAGWPDINQQALNIWQQAIQALAKFDNLALKLSGWEMTDRHWQLSQVQPIIEHCLQHFGKHRLMLGSNFPLCLWTKSYQQLWQEYADKLYQQAPRLFAANARHWYRIEG